MTLSESNEQSPKVPPEGYELSKAGWSHVIQIGDLIFREPNWAWHLVTDDSMAIGYTLGDLHSVVLAVAVKAGGKKRGGARKGGGRKPEVGTPMERTNVILDAESLSIMREVGGGNLSKGIRAAARYLKKHFPDLSVIREEGE